MGNMLKRIDAVLDNAEHKQLTDRAMNMWLDNLRDLAYDVEDVLDEFYYQGTRAQAEGR